MYALMSYPSGSVLCCEEDIFTLLGINLQVVKRAGQMGNGGFADSHPPAGSKRSVRDRLGSDVDGIQFNNKRFVLSLLSCCFRELSCNKYTAYGTNLAGILICDN